MGVIIVLIGTLARDILRVQTLSPGEMRREIGDRGIGNVSPFRSLFGECVAETGTCRIARTSD